MRTKFTLTILVCLITASDNFAQYWKSIGGLAGSGSSTYLIGASHVGETIIVLSREQTIAYTTDFGATWTKQTAAKPAGTITSINGIKDRLYASFKINNYDFELYYTTDNGATWTIDTVGLPENITKTGKSGMILKYMGNDYILAHNYTTAVYKKLGDTQWQSTYIDNVIVDISSTNDKWLAVGQGKLLQSTDNGGSWTSMGTNGLPENFQGNLICSNGSRIYVSDPPAAGADDIYFSDDGGASWTLTNSAGKFDYANPWIQVLYAVDDYIFASISPKFANFQDAPPFILSSTETPNFYAGDITGLPTGGTTTHIPFYFHIGDKLVTMFGDLYMSEPGFTGETTTAIHTTKNQAETMFVYPNPTSQNIRIQLSNDISSIQIYNTTGKKIMDRRIHINEPIDVSNLFSGVYFLNATSDNGKTFKTNFIKR